MVCWGRGQSCRRCHRRSAVTIPHFLFETVHRLLRKRNARPVVSRNVQPTARADAARPAQELPARVARARHDLRCGPAPGAPLHPGRPLKPRRETCGVRAYTIPDEFRLRTPFGDRRSCRVIWRKTRWGSNSLTMSMPTTVQATGLQCRN
jgi:hypothetical protein